MAPTMTLGSGVTVDLGGNALTNAADGVNPQDVATVAQLGGGGSATAGRYAKGGLVVANTTFVDVDWAFVLGSGTNLLDLTDPQNPTVLATAAYSIAVNIIPAAAGAAGTELTVFLSFGPFSPGTVQPMDTAGALTGYIVSPVWPLTAGDVINVEVWQNSGGPITMGCVMWVTKLG